MTSPRRGLTSTHGTNYDPTEHWAERAECRNHDPELWHIGGSDMDAQADRAEAKRICLTRCPVVIECRRTALDNREEWGVWGGLDSDERRALLRKRTRTPAAATPATPNSAPAKTPAKPRHYNAAQQERRALARANALKRRDEGREPAHGTRAAYDHHRALGEPYCDPCRTHRRDARRNELRANRKTRTQITGDALITEVRHLIAQGADIHEAARIVERTPDALIRALQRYGKHNLAAALKRAA